MMLSLELRYKLLKAVSQNPKNISKMAKGLSNYAHIFNSVKAMQRIGLVEICAIGKENKVKLTLEGHRLLKTLDSIKQYFSFLEKGK